MAGTISRGIKAPIIRQGDDIVAIVADSVLSAAQQDGFSLHERDVICVTEAVVARADGNYASTDDIAADVKTNRRSLPNSQQKPLCHLPARHCQRREKSCADAQLPLR